MVTWEELVIEELARLRAETGRERVELHEVYDCTLERAEQEFPNNQHPQAKIRQMLQRLCDGNEVEFLEDGVYRITDELNDTSAAADQGSILDELESELGDLSPTEPQREQ